jgi:hypothetical protein
MITRALVLAMVLAITLVVATPAFSQGYSQEHQFPHGVFVTDNGSVGKGDISAGNCRDLGPDRPDIGPDNFFRGVYSESDIEKIVSLCEKKGFSVAVERQTSLSKTGGPPLILVPTALLVACGFLIRKSTAL